MSHNYLIIGDDEYIRETETARIRDKYLKPAEVELNYSVHAPDDIDGIMNSLGTMPFLADKRVVLMRGAEALSEASVETISKYLENPSGSGVLVLTAEGSFKKSKEYRKISKLLQEIDAANPDPARIKSWIRTFFKKENIEISPEAVDLIAELKGTDTAAVKMELEKLASFAGGKRIEAAHVEELVGRSVQETVFKLVDAINARDGGWAFRIINDLYDQKKQTPEIIGYLGWYIRIMQKITLLSARGIGQQNMASELGYSPAYVRRLTDQAKKYPVKRIEQWTSLLLDTDRDIKTGRKEATVAL